MDTGMGIPGLSRGELIYYSFITNSPLQVFKMRWKLFIFLVMLSVFLVCTSGASLTPVSQVKKITDSATLKNTNSSLSLLKSNPGEGFTFFDGKQILQNKTVMEDAMKKPLSSIIDKNDLVKFETTSEPPSPGNEDPFQEITDWSGSSSHVLKYYFILTNGAIGAASSGAFGYSPSAKLFIGDKYPSYHVANELTPPKISDLGTSLRLMIDPVQKKVLLQAFDTGSTTPLVDNAMNIEATNSGVLNNGMNYLYISGKRSGDNDVYGLFIECA